MNTIKLGHLVSITGGGTPDRSNPDFWGGNIPWATLKDFKALEISSTMESITDAGLKASTAKIAAAGSIIVPTRMAIGKAAINAVPVAINQDLKALRVLDPEMLDRDYLFRFLLSKATYLESQGKGATVKGITLNILQDLDVPVLPIREQQRIATVLSKADSLRRKRQEAIQLADDLLKAAYLNLVQRNPIRAPIEVLLAEVPNASRMGPFASQLLLNAPPIDIQLKFEEIASRIKRMSSAQALAAKGTDELIASLSAKYFELKS